MNTILLITGIFVGTPILAYFVVKFGVAGGPAGLRRKNKTNKKSNEEQV